MRRDGNADAVMAGVLADVTLGDRPLLVGAGQELTRALRAAAPGMDIWTRFASPAGKARPWPPEGPFTAALIRLPRSKPELDMQLHAVASVCVPGAPICVYGANDEGIKSISPRLEQLLGPVQTVASRRHCRVLSSVRPDTIAGLKATLAAWRETWPLELAGEMRPWVSYPGLFAHGRLDAGTALLINALEDCGPVTSAVDFACGTGIVAAAIASRNPTAALTLIDADSLALEAARENVGPSAQFLLGTSLAACRSRDHDLIVSNPPIHAGKDEDRGVVQRLIADAPGYLRRGGSLMIIVQHRVAVVPALTEAFGNAEELRRSAGFNVFRATKQPRKT